MARSDGQDGEAPADQEMLRRIAIGLDTLPRLTRAVYLIHRLDNLSYEEVAWRCGIGVDEVMLRMSAALCAARWAVDGHISIIGRIRRGLLPWRLAWMRRRMQRVDRRLGLR